MQRLLLLLSTVVLVSSYPTPDPCNSWALDSVTALVKQLSKDIVPVAEQVHKTLKSHDELRMYGMILDVGSALEMTEKQRIEQVAVMFAEMVDGKVQRDTVFKAPQTVYLFEYLTKNLRLLGLRSHGTLRSLVTLPYRTGIDWKETSSEDKETMISKSIFSQMCNKE